MARPLVMHMAGLAPTYINIIMLLTEKKREEILASGNTPRAWLQLQTAAQRKAFAQLLCPQLASKQKVRPQLHTRCLQELDLEPAARHHHHQHRQHIRSRGSLALAPQTNNSRSAREPNALGTSASRQRKHMSSRCARGWASHQSDKGWARATHLLV